MIAGQRDGPRRVRLTSIIGLSRFSVAPID